MNLFRPPRRAATARRHRGGLLDGVARVVAEVHLVEIIRDLGKGVLVRRARHGPDDLGPFVDGTKSSARLRMLGVVRVAIRAQDDGHGLEQVSMAAFPGRVHLGEHQRPGTAIIARRAAAEARAPRAI